MSTDRELDVSVVMPAFNEADVVGTAIDRTASVLADAGLDWEIVVVDDGSTDGTGRVAEGAALGREGVKVVRLETNQGKGAALRHGFHASSGTWVAFLDADLDIDPAQVVEYLARALESGVDVLVASKHHPDSDLKYPWHRKLASRAYSLAVGMAFGLPVADTQTGLKLFRREVLDKVFDRVLAKGFAFDVELLALAHDAGYRIGQAPVRVCFHREHARIRLLDYLATGFDTLLVLGRLKAGHRFKGRDPSA